jgi:hypothetical protein
MTAEEELKSEDVVALLQRIARELTTVRQHTTLVIGYVRDAEADMPERYRRFVNAFHDVHDIKYMYEEHGQPVPEYILSEIRRMDDRYRQILKELNAEGGTFNKIRREMSKDPENRYDHTRLLDKPKETKDEQREESRTDLAGSEPSGGEPAGGGVGEPRNGEREDSPRSE